MQAFAIPQKISLIHHTKTHFKITWHAVNAEMLHTKYMVDKGINKYMIYLDKTGETYIHIYMHIYLSKERATIFLRKLRYQPQYIGSIIAKVVDSDSCNMNQSTDKYGKVLPNDAVETPSVPPDFPRSQRLRPSEEQMVIRNHDSQGNMEKKSYRTL